MNLFSSTTVAQEPANLKELKVIRGVSSQQRTTHYFHQILAEALYLEGQGSAYKLTPVDFEFSQNRTLKLLNLDNVLDITYSMTSPAREKDFIAIKVPLLNGLYGKRRLLVLADNKLKFEQLSISQLKQLIACQGMHWPDYNRLDANGFSVYGVIDYEANFKMLGKGRCDYFPRGIAEIDLDFKKYNGVYGDLAKVDNIMFVYHAPIYFFVGQHQKKLANIVESGLLQMQDSGRLDQALEQSNAFPFDPNFEKNVRLKIVHLQ
ncbi:transporter substrate-binding domain-containing protein [Paraglaciecola aquimarina]|uniref:Transporter substrate-binding domain-containing protein n=1 Tax=Paraglaciecola algarum TaxID=3050085 RepID=A0ABS9D1H2_9ALTE|nr:transporter substrate-binding domain-containing protein [Paraglaciecola sp. G1-23]MCF2946585.1 transporter substrate-binding domain-containing protein [Paraglaciecola sp. G1-23]